ncbi:flagellar hook-length control protein FliK [Arcobacter arenosus]|uniref:flagellar hook-length control protein FliK n=1 Tax=Arcobacter arenosus TaxID=2576037 RepID=UPI003BAC82AD
MIVSNNNNLLNILLPNDNKVLKEALKNADAQTLQKFQNGTATVGDILKNLFENLKTSDKSQVSIQNFLKDTNVFKMEQNFSKSIEQVLSQLKSNPSLEKFTNQIETLLKNISNLDENSLKQMIDKSGIFLESKIANQINLQTGNQGNLPKNIAELLTQIKTLIKDIPNLEAKNITNLIDKILQTNSNQTITPNNLQGELKTLVSNLQNLLSNISSKEVTNLSNLTQKLENLSSQAQLVESKIANTNTQVENNLLNNKEIINTKTLETLLTLKQELVNIKGIDTKPLNQLIDKLLNLQNLFTKIDLPNLNQSGFQSNFATNLDSLLTNLKTSIQNLSSSSENLNLHQNINKTIHKLETIINNLIQNPNNFLPKESNPIQNDMKALLLQVQAELISKGDSNSQETIKQIDRLITQIEYHQLQSLVSNSNNVYIPFLWDMLDEGSISMKKINEDKFYCEINLSLKEFGETNLLLALYDKNKLDLTIYASKNSFKETLQKSLPKLRSSLNSVDLIPVNIKIVDIKKEDTKEQKQMNQFNQNNDFINPNFGIDIRV